MGKVARATQAAVHIGHMHDQRVVCRAPLDGKNRGYCLNVVGVRRQPVNGFGGQAKQAAAAQGALTTGQA